MFKNIKIKKNSFRFPEGRVTQKKKHNFDPSEPGKNGDLLKKYSQSKTLKKAELKSFWISGTQNVLPDIVIEYRFWQRLQNPAFEKPESKSFWEPRIQIVLKKQNPKRWKSTNENYISLSKNSVFWSDEKYFPIVFKYSFYI